MLDQQITETIQKKLQEILIALPIVRSLGLTVTYDVQNPGSLPTTMFMPRGPLDAKQVFTAIRTADHMSVWLREQHDRVAGPKKEQLGESDSQSPVPDQG